MLEILGVIFAVYLSVCVVCVVFAVLGHICDCFRG